MADNPPLTEEERAELIAYLDGELKGQAAKTFEGKLNNDPRMRTEAESLRRTWQLLDYLPRPEPSPTFTSRTLERLSAVQPEFRLAQQGRKQSWPLWLAWAAAVVVAGSASYAGTRLFFYRKQTPPLDQVQVDKQLTRDLRVIDNLHSYESLDDFQFLKNLADPNDPDLFGDDNADS